MKFYEVQQKTQASWVSVGFFLDKKKAEKYKNKFNTGTMVSPVRIVKRKFLDELQ